MKPLATLNAFFNTDPDNRKPMKEFAAEVKELDNGDKVELATLASAEMGTPLELS